MELLPVEEELEVEVSQEEREAMREEILRRLNLGRQEETVSEAVTEEDEVLSTAEASDETPIDWEFVEETMTKTPEGLRSISSDRFIILAPSETSMSWMVTLTQEAHRVVSRFVLRTGEVGNTVTFFLQPFEGEGDPPPFRTQIFPNGEVRVTIPWGERTNRRVVMQGVFQGILASEIHARAGLQEAVSLRPWLELGLTLALEVHLVPTMLDEFQREAERLEWRPLEELFNQRSPLYSASTVAQNAYWFLRWFERQLIRPDQRGAVLLGLATHSFPSDILEVTFPRAWKAEPGLTFWWASRFQEVLTIQNSPYQRMDQSRETMRRLATIHFKMDQGNQSAPMRDWSGWVLFEPARQALRSNLLELRGQLGVVHPIYFNSMQSLGILIEFCIEEFDTEEKLARFEQLLNLVESDFRTALRLEQEIFSGL